MLPYIELLISVFRALSLFCSIGPFESRSAGHSLQDLCSRSQVGSSQLKSPLTVLTQFPMPDLQAKYVCLFMFWLGFFFFLVQSIAQHLLTTVAFFPLPLPSSFLVKFLSEK